MLAIRVALPSSTYNQGTGFCNKIIALKYTAPSCVLGSRKIKSSVYDAHLIPRISIFKKSLYLCERPVVRGEERELLPLVLERPVRPRGRPQGEGEHGQAAGAGDEAGHGEGGGAGGAGGRVAVTADEKRCLNTFAQEN